MSDDAKPKRYEMTQFLQISDTHIVKTGSLVSGRLETSGPLKRLALRIAELQFEVGPLDAIVVTGDVSDDGTAESYALFKSILKPLNLPFFVFLEIMMPARPFAPHLIRRVTCRRLVS